MTIGFPQFPASNSATSNSIGVTLGQAPAIGNLIIAIAGAATNAISMASPSGGWSLISPFGADGSTGVVAIFARISTGDRVYTTSTVGSVAQFLAVYEISGAANTIAAAIPSANSHNSNPTGKSINTNSVTPTTGISFVAIAGAFFSGTATGMTDSPGYNLGTVSNSRGAFANTNPTGGAGATSDTFSWTNVNRTSCACICVVQAPTAAPSVTTDGTVTGVTANMALGNGNVTADGGDNITERGIVWGTSAAPTKANSFQTTSGTTGAFSSVAMTNLLPNTTYFYRSYAINSLGTTYSSGNGTQFTTLTWSTLLSLGVG